jgi:hypothetical protein
MIGWVRVDSSPNATNLVFSPDAILAQTLNPCLLEYFLTHGQG